MKELGVILFGASTLGKAFLEKSSSGLQVIAFTDNDSAKWGNEFCGLPVCRPLDIIRMEFDYVVISSCYVEAIFCQLLKMGIPKWKIKRSLESINFRIYKPKSKTRLLVMNDVGFQYGAGIATGRQVVALLDAGFEVGLVCGYPGPEGDAFIESSAVSKECWLGIDELPVSASSPASVDESVIEILEKISPDAVLFGNIHGMNWPVSMLAAAARHTVHVFVYLHDCYYFTGRCAYIGSCEKFLFGCDDSCPTAHEPPRCEPSQIASSWIARRRLFSECKNIDLLANSSWTAEQLRRAIPSIEAERIHLMPLGIDSKAFYPSTVSRKFRKRVRCICSAVSFKDERKGGKALKAVIDLLSDEVDFVAIGHPNDELDVEYVGYLTKESAVADAIRTCDIALSTALEESFGQSILEASMCGLPVVAFDVGGIGDIIIDGLNGLLVPVGDIDAIVRALKRLVENPSIRAKLGKEGRVRAVENFSQIEHRERWAQWLQIKNLNVL